MSSEIIILQNKTFWESIVSETYSYALLLTAFAISQYFIGSVILDSILVIIFTLALLVKASKSKVLKFKSAKDAIEHLEKQK